MAGRPFRDAPSGPRLRGLRRDRVARAGGAGGVLGGLDLEGRMADAEAPGHGLLGPPQDIPGFRLRSHRQVGAQGHELRGDRPDVEVVDVEDAVDRGQGRPDGPGVDVGRGALHEDVDGVADEPGRAPEDEQADGGADDGVPDEGAGQADEQGRQEDADAPQGVADDVEEGAADVDVPLAAPEERRSDGDVGQQAEAGHCEHQAPLHGLRGPDPQEGLVADRDRDDPESGAVDEGGEDLEAAPAEGVPGRRRPGREPEGEQGQAQRGGVGEHVARVGEQGQAMAQKAAGDLDDEDGGGDGERQPERSAGCLVRVGQFLRPSRA